MKREDEQCGARGEGREARGEGREQDHDRIKLQSNGPYSTRYHLKGCPLTPVFQKKNRSPQHVYVYELRAMKWDFAREKEYTTLGSTVQYRQDTFVRVSSFVERTKTDREASLLP